MDQELISWLLVLSIGFPLLGLILGELADYFARQKHPLAKALRYLRQYMLPLLGCFLLMTQVLKIAKSQDGIRILETLTILSILWSLVSLVSSLLTTGQPLPWQIKVPNLFFQVVRGAVVLGLGYYLLSGVWQIDLTGLATAVGVGSLVIALALQDTLSNLVSGLLLLLASPFKTGDWISFENTEARVVEQNWWSVTLENAQWDYQVVVPNGRLSQAKVTNYGQRGIWKDLSVSFSYDDPPNQVVAALKKVTRGLDNLEAEALISARSFEEDSIRYEIRYKVLPEQVWDTYRELLHRIYYAAKRQGLTMPYPGSIAYNIELSDDTSSGLPALISSPKTNEAQRQEFLDFLQSLPYFFALSDTELNLLFEASKLVDYGAGEVITQEGEGDDGIYIIFSGRVKTFTQDYQGKLQNLATFGDGEVFGEMALFPGEVSPLTAVALEDSRITVIPDDEVVALIQGNNQVKRNAQFASDMMQFIAERRKVLRLAKGNLEELASSSTSGQGALDLLSAESDSRLQNGKNQT